MSIRAQVLVLALALISAANPAQARFRAPEVHEPLPQAEMAVPEPTEAPVAPVQANAAGEAEAAPVDEPLAATLSTSAEPVAAVAATPADPLFAAGSLVPAALAPAIELPAVNANGTSIPLAAAAMAGSFVNSLTGAEPKASPLHRFQTRRKATR